MFSRMNVINAAMIVALCAGAVALAMSDPPVVAEGASVLASSLGR